MDTVNEYEQEHMVACDRVFILEKKYKKNPSPAAFNAIVEASADLVCKGHNARIKQQKEMCGTKN